MHLSFLSALLGISLFCLARGEVVVNVPVVLGTYELTKSENFEEYMGALGVGIVMRKLAAHASPETTITKNGNQWHFRTTTTFTSSDIKFELGVPFKEDTPDGRSCLSTITAVNDHTFNHVQKNCGGGAEGLLITREFTGNELKMVLTAPSDDGLIVCKRVYKKN